MTSLQSRLLCLAAALLFSTGGAVIKGTALTGWQIACLRSAIAALTIFALMPASRRPSPMAWTVGVAYAVTMVLFVVANTLTTAAHTAFLQATAPLHLVLLGPLLLGERARRAEVLLMIPMGVGLALLLFGSGEAQATAPRPFLGNALGLVTGVSWALTLLGMRALGKRGESSLSAVFAGSVIATLAAAGPALATGGVGFGLIGADSSFESGALLSVLWLGVFQIGLAYVFLARGVEHVSALEASLLLLLEPVASPLWAWAWHGEAPGALALFGGAIILAASVSRLIPGRRD